MLTHVQPPAVQISWYDAARPQPRKSRCVAVGAAIASCSIAHCMSTVARPTAGTTGCQSQRRRPTHM
jgi:hypothetical protein